MDQVHLWLTNNIDRYFDWLDNRHIRRSERFSSPPLRYPTLDPNLKLNFTYSVNKQFRCAYIKEDIYCLFYKFNPNAPKSSSALFDGMATQVERASITNRRALQDDRMFYIDSQYRLKFREDLSADIKSYGYTYIMLPKEKLIDYQQKLNTNNIVLLTE